MQVVVDANIIHGAFSKNDFDCLSVAMEIRNNTLHSLAIDMNGIGRIWGEYRKQVKGNAGTQRALEKWHDELWKRKKIQMYNGKLTENNRNLLVQSGFHEPEDHVYVAVALQADRYIVTEDSDYKDAENEIAKLGITFKGAADAYNTLREVQL